ncbi:MAG: hypothetical protein JOZ41_04920, partial [Chloroflexi bacterium]|nr:hypothetical protein [Chloroflexota bacterium]
AASEEGLWGRAEGLRGLALNYLGRMEEAREALEGALPLLEGAGDLPWLASAVGNLGENRRVVGDLTGALRLTCRALELAVRTGNVVHTKFFHLNLAQILLVTGEWGSARDHLARVEGMGQTLTISVHVAPTLPLHLGTLALREGNWEDAAELLCRSAELAAGTIREVLEEALAALAELAVLRREPKEARDRVEGLVEEEGAALPLLLPVLAWAHLGLGDAERALELAERAEREARGRGTLLYLPEALRIKGMALLRVGWTKEAREVLTEGRERARAMPNPYTEARTLVELGLLDRQEEERERAREQLEEALAIFRQLGARKDIERSEQELAALHR